MPPSSPRSPQRSSNCRAVLGKERVAVKTSRCRSRAQSELESQAATTYLWSDSPLTTASRRAWTQRRLGAACPCCSRPPTRSSRSGHLCTSSPTARGLQLAKAASSRALYSSPGTQRSQQGDELSPLTTSRAQRLTSERMAELGPKPKSP